MRENAPMMIVKPEMKLQVFMVKTPQGVRPRFQRGQDRLDKSQKNAVGLQEGRVTTVTEDMFLIMIGEREYTVYLKDTDLPGFVEF